MIVHILMIYTFYFVHVSFFTFLRGVELRDFFYIRNAEGVFSLCNLLLQQYSFLYIHTLYMDCPNIEVVQLPFCARFIFFPIFDGC